MARREPAAAGTALCVRKGGGEANAAVGVDAAVDERGATGEEDAAALDGGLAFDAEKRSDAGEEEERRRRYRKM